MFCVLAAISPTSYCACTSGIPDEPGDDPTGRISDAGVAEQTSAPGVVDPALGIPLPGAQWSSSGGQILLIGGWEVPISLVPGFTAPPISASVRDNAATCQGCIDQNAVLMQLVSFEGDSGTVLAQQSSDHTGQTQTLQLIPTHVVTPTEILRVRFSTPMELGQVPTRMSGVGVVRVGGFEPPKTLTVPLFGPFVTSGSMSATLNMSSSSMTAYAPFSLPSGSTITRVRAVLADNASGPTTLKVGLAKVDSAIGTAAAVGFGGPSAGTGAVQSVESGPLFEVVAYGRWYAAEVTYNSGTSATSVKAIGVDYIP